MNHTTNYTTAEIISVCIARQVHTGQVWAQGLNTPLVMAGLILAKLTHAPDVRFASAIGQGITQNWGPLSVTRAEDLWLGQSLSHVGFAVGAAELLPAYQPHEFFRPAQVDANGNTNNIAFGKDYKRPRLRLPGSGGIPDVTVQYDHTYLYVPRHSRLIFREPIDFISGLGHSPQRTQGNGPRYLVSDLGQFDWHEGRLRLTSYHAGVTIDDVQKRTGFALLIAPDVHETPPPNADELRLLRQTIDPLRVRDLEILGGSARKTLLRQIIDAESAM